MRKPAAILFTMIMLAWVLPCAAQDHSRGTASISGKVITLDDRPAGNARVEARDAMTGATVQSTYTNQAGQFEINNLPAGRYSVVAVSGLDQAQQDIPVSQASDSIILRLPRMGSAAPGDNTVSVQHMMVPGKAQSALKHAREALARQRMEEAWKQVAKALAIYPQYAEALALRGILQLDQKNVDGARTDLEEAIKDDPGYAMAYVILGAAYNLQSQFDSAVRTLDRGVALSPTSWQGYYELGKAYLGQGDFEGSLRQLDKAQEFAPKAYAPLHLVKAHALLGLKDYTSAVTELEAYLANSPKGEGSDQARDTLQKVRAFVASNRH